MLCWIMVSCAVMPSFFSFVETPRFQYKAGKLTGLIFVLDYISRFNKKEVGKSELVDLLSEQNKQVAAVICKKQIFIKIKGKSEEESKLAEIAKESRHGSAFREMFTTKEYLK